MAVDLDNPRSSLVIPNCNSTFEHGRLVYPSGNALPIAEKYPLGYQSSSRNPRDIDIASNLEGQNHMMKSSLQQMVTK